MSHVIADGFGIFAFIDILLNAYVGNKPSAWQGLTQPDFVADLMACDLPLPEGYEMHDFADHDSFVVPEAETEEPQIATYRVKTKALTEYCKLHGVSKQVALSFVMAKAINLVHPESARVHTPRNTLGYRSGYARAIPRPHARTRRHSDRSSLLGSPVSWNTSMSSELAFTIHIGPVCSNRSKTRKPALYKNVTSSMSSMSLPAGHASRTSLTRR